MKKATAILLSSVIFASLLCSCGKAADSSAVSSAVSTKTTSPTAAPTEAPTPEPTQQPAGQPASQLFSKETGFSRMERTLSTGLILPVTKFAALSMAAATPF